VVVWLGHVVIRCFPSIISALRGKGSFDDCFTSDHSANASTDLRRDGKLTDWQLCIPC